MNAHLAEPIAFPDAEALLVTHLPTVLDGEPVSTQIPNPRPSRWVRVLRTGGPRTGLTRDEAQVTFECWDDDSVGASELSRLVRAHVWAMPGRVDGVFRVEEMSGPASLPDPHSEQPRYTFTAVIHIRGSAL